MKMMMKKFKGFAILIALGALFAFAGCKNETEDEAVSVEKVEITSTVTQVTRGRSVTLKAKVSPENASDKTVKWSTSDAEIATVDESTGLVKGVKGGNVTITATAGGKSASVDITVNTVIEFTGFTIPKAATSYVNKEVTAYVTGVNFQEADIDASKFSLACIQTSITSGSTATVLSDTLLSVTLKCPATAGSYKVNVYYNSNMSDISGTFNVVKSKGYAAGDVILKDGSKIAASKVYTGQAEFETEGDKVPVAVVFTDDYGVEYGLGLYDSVYVNWAWSNTTGYKTNFTDICSDYIRKTDVTNISYIFTGDLDGSDNWEKICQVDPEGSKKSDNYGLFYAALEYGTSHGYTNTDFEDGWYIPSIYELDVVRRNYIGVLKTPLAKIAAANTTDGVNSSGIGNCIIDSVSYWSSSQSPNANTYAITNDFADGYIIDTEKSRRDSMGALFIRAL